MKIGIITQYFNSHNYGGNLQAYALVKFLRNHKYDAEQISYDMFSTKKQYNKGSGSCLRRIARFIYYGILKIMFFYRHLDAKRKIEARNNAIDLFNRNIPHSEEIYNENNINDANAKYDVFITGSDVVWLPHNLNTAFFLNFVDTGKKRISYAASLGIASLTDQEYKEYYKNLSSFDAISVRERQSVSLLKDISHTEVVHVLDPVFLLEANEWKEIASERIIKNKYLFCYFLGNDEKTRQIAQEYAQKRNLEIVTLPYLQGVYSKSDYNFGEHKLFDVTANDFLSLIFHADFIMTDSFHVTAFSVMFEKEFVVFQRDNNKHISTRLADFTTELNVETRYCNSIERKNVNYINQLETLNYKNVIDKIALRKNQSKDFVFYSLQ